MLKKLAFVGTVALGMSAFAQGKPADKAAPPAKAEAMPVPVLPPEGKKLVEGMLGNWKSSDTVMTMGDKSFKGKLDMKCEKASGGWATLCKGSADMGKEMPKQEVTFLFGWDVGAQEGHMFEVSNMAEVHNHSGKWADDKTITLVHDGKNAEGKEEKDSLTMTWTSPKELSMKAVGTQGANTVWTFTSVAKK